MPQQPIVGLHHVTAFASDPQQNLDFYTDVLGLRFVKRTINFDDPGTYHFYFGDDAGSPGTIFTFFPWPRAARAVAGAGEVVATAFSVPPGSLDFWHDRLTAKGVLVERAGQRFGDQTLSFADPDGMRLEMVGHHEIGASAGSGEALKAPRFASVPPEHSVRGFFGVTLLERDEQATRATLAMLGFPEVAREGNRVRYAAASDALGHRIDVLVDAKAAHGRSGAGSVHHIAFRAADDASQLEWRAEIETMLEVTPVLDRTYFHSIYFRESGGVLFELATDPPGFTFDEPIESLGEALCLPEWLEPRRAELERRLAPLTLNISPKKAEVAI